MKFKKMFFRGTAFMLAVATAFSCPVIASEVTVDSDPTFENIMDYATTWDAEAAHFFNAVADTDDITQWWSEGEGLGKNMETAVHEECHEYTSYKHWYGQDRIYAGDGQDILIGYGDFYDTSIMAEEIPEDLRTFRFDSYVSAEASEGNLKASCDGIYGLIDEYNAYSWGMNTSLCMYDFLYESGADMDVWMDEFVNSASNNVLAYAEFNFWILRYMVYAKENKPKCYQSVLDNEELLQAYFTITSRFENMLGEFEELLDKLPDVLAGQDYSVTIDTDGIQCKSGIYTYTYPFTHESEGWEKLLTEVQKSEYQEVLSEMQQAYPDIIVTGIIPDGSICGARGEISETYDSSTGGSSKSVTTSTQKNSSSSSDSSLLSSDSDVMRIINEVLELIVKVMQIIIEFIKELFEELTEYARGLQGM